MAETLKEKTIAAFFWVILDKAGGGVVNFLITIALARLLSPGDFGLVAMVMVFFEISSVFVGSGFYVALIREQNLSAEDKSTTFIFNLVMAAILYVALFFAAPGIAAFFSQPVLIWVVRIMGVNLIISSFDLIQRAQLTQRIDFKTQTKARLLAVLVSGIVAIVMALYGWGVWSLVVKFGLQSLINTAALWVASPWRPSWQFSWPSFWRLFGFGYKVLIAGLLDKFFQQAYQIIIGRFFSAATLGFYAQASYFSQLVIGNLFMTVEKIAYPVLAALQDDRAKLKAGYRKIIKMSSFALIPAMILTGILAEPMVLSLVGEKWLPSVPFLQLLCIAGGVYHFNAINLNMLLVLGRSDIGLKLEVIKKLLVSAAIIVGFQFGVYGLVIGQVITAYLILSINTYYSRKFLDYSFFEQIRDVLSSIGFSIVAGGLVPHERSS